MKVLVFVFLFAYVHAAVTIPEPTRKTTSAEAAKKDYILDIYATYTWFHAFTACQVKHMRLATIDSPAEQNQVVKLIEKHGYTKERFWISGADLATEGHFFWFTNGKHFEYSNWGPNQPNNDKKNQDCVEVQPKSQNYTWNDNSCHSHNYVICEHFPNVCTETN